MFWESSTFYLLIKIINNKNVIFSTFFCVHFCIHSKSNSEFFISSSFEVLCKQKLWLSICQFLKKLFFFFLVYFVFDNKFWILFGKRKIFSVINGLVKCIIDIWDWSSSCINEDESYEISNGFLLNARCSQVSNFDVHKTLGCISLNDFLM